jgi:glycerol-3-phosphate dehydrogenase
VSGDDFVAFLAAAPRSAAARGFDPRLVLSLAARHGSRLGAVLDLARTEPALGERLCNHGPTLRAEIAHAADAEMALTLTDALLGRTAAAFRACQALHCAAAAAAIMGARLGWNAARQDVEVVRYRDRLRLERGARFVP